MNKEKIYNYNSAWIYAIQSSCKLLQLNIFASSAYRAVTTFTLDAFGRSLMKKL